MVLQAGYLDRPAAVGFVVALSEALIDGVQLRFCLCHARTGFEAADDTHVTIVASFLCRIQRQRYPHLRLNRIVETLRHHANDSRGLPADRDFAADDVRVGAKAALPQSITDDCNRVSSGLSVIRL